MREIVFNHPGVRALLHNMAEVRTTEDDPCIGVLRNDVPWGGVVYTNYTGSAMYIHMAGRDETWVTRDMLLLAYQYPFLQLGVRVLIGVVNSSNKLALSADLRMGFKIAATVKYGFPDGDAILLTMHREECPWLGHKLRGWKFNTMLGLVSEKIDGR